MHNHVDNLVLKDLLNTRAKFYSKHELSDLNDSDEIIVEPL